MASLAINLFPLFTLIASSIAVQCPTITSQCNFKIEKYTGFWYEVARIPNVFEQDFKCRNATYTLNSNGTLNVFLQATTTQGQYTSVRGLATVIDPNVPASFRVVFETGQQSGSNILDTDYNHYAAIYSCDFFPDLGVNVEVGYIFSREKTLQSSKLKKAKKAFTDNGIDASRLLPTIQNC